MKSLNTLTTISIKLANQSLIARALKTQDNWTAKNVYLILYLSPLFLPPLTQLKYTTINSLDTSKA